MDGRVNELERSYQKGEESFLQDGPGSRAFTLVTYPLQFFPRRLTLPSHSPTTSCVLPQHRDSAIRGQARLRGVTCNLADDEDAGSVEISESRT